MNPGAARWRRATGRLLTLALGARTLWLAYRYLNGSPQVVRFQLESQATAFVIVGLVFIFSSSNPATRLTGREPLPSRKWVSALAWTLWCAGAAVLYWPALTIGLLSDDFVLAGRAARFQLAAFNTVAFRPVPIALWGAVLQSGGGPTGLHLVNVVLHGMNACLVSRLARPLVRDGSAALMAGLVFLTLPVVPEAVAWSSGVFDVTATTLVLVTILVGRGYAGEPSRGRRLAFLTLGGAALLCKETAVVAGLFVLLDAWARGHRNRRLFQDAAGLLLLSACVGLVRLALVPSPARQPVTRYLIQRWIFGTFGGLVVPWHAEVMAAHAWLPVAGAAIVIVMIAFFFMVDGGNDRARAAAAAAAWMPLATLPALTLFFVAPDLQGARYLYLSGVGFAVLMAVLVDTLSHTGGATAGRSAPRELVALAGCGAIVILGAVGVRLHLAPWREAAAVRDRIQLAARADVRMASCDAPVFQGLPETVRGAYVFRNGTAEALAASTPGGTAASADGSCTFTWTGEGFVDGR